MRAIVAAVMAVWLIASHAQSGLPRLELDPAAPQTRSNKAVDGFWGWLLVTAEDDLLEALEPPSKGISRSTSSPTVSVGDALLLAIFYANPALRSDRTGEVQCDVQVIQPDGVVSMDEKGQSCFKGSLEAGKEGLYMPGLILRFTGGPADPEGEWNVRVSLKDVVRGAEISLQRAFVLTASRKSPSQTPNPSIERTSSTRLSRLAAAAHVERSVP